MFFTHPGLEAIFLFPGPGSEIELARATEVIQAHPGFPGTPSLHETYFFKPWPFQPQDAWGWWYSPTTLTCMSVTSQQTCVRQEIEVKAWCTPVSEVGCNEPRVSKPFPNAVVSTNKLRAYLLETCIYPKPKLPFQVRDHRTPVSGIT